MVHLKRLLALFILASLSRCGSVKGSLGYSRSVNTWNRNQWNGNVVSVTAFDTNPYTPNTTIWYDPVTGAQGISFGVTVLTVDLFGKNKTQ